MDSKREAIRRQVFTEIIEKVLAYDAARGNPPFNFADTESVAVEAKNRGYLSSTDDVALLMEVITNMTPVDEATCRDEITPVLSYPLALDTESCETLSAIILTDGRSNVARRIGIAPATLEKFETGGKRGPIFRHFPVSEKSVLKVRSFLVGQKS